MSALLQLIEDLLISPERSIEIRRTPEGYILSINHSYLRTGNVELPEDADDHRPYRDKLLQGLEDSRCMKLAEHGSIPSEKTVKPSVLYFVYDQLRRFERKNGDPCIDNRRWCRVGNKDQERGYELLRERGCCGNEEHEFRHRGETYRVGFNYGH
jgi:hypothetical protein